MKWLVRGTLGILAALAVASVAPAQFRPSVGSLPASTPPIVIPPLPQLPPIPPMRYDSLGPAFLPGPVQVTPPREGVNPQIDGGGDCENRDGNALNDPDDCGNNGRPEAPGNVSAGAPTDATASAPTNASASAPADASTSAPAEGFVNESAANVASEPAAPGWRPSWWMIVLGVGAVLLLLGRRR